jgi:hypothetical protein
MTMPLAPPHLDWVAFRLPKAGHAAAECEDAYAADAHAGRFAVADGASESAFAGAWADALAAGYVAHRGPWSAWLADARADWLGRFQDEAMPWYVETKFDDGAFATLLGLQLRCGDGLGWRAQAVGDCCVFQVRGDTLHRAFPMKRATDFDNGPSLIGSRPRLPASPRYRRGRARGRARVGDTFLLATDALAQWFLENAVDGGRPWARLAAVDDAEAFAALVAELRSAGRLRNDDTTLVRVRVGPVPREAGAND